MSRVGFESVGWVSPKRNPDCVLKGLSLDCRLLISLNIISRQISTMARITKFETWIKGTNITSSI
jgi:hypothetical protein